MLLLAGAGLVESRPALLVLGDPRPAYVPFWISSSIRRIVLLGLFGHDSRAAGVVAVLGRIADGVAHVVQAAAVHQIDDQLQLVHALEIGDFRLVACLHQRFEAGLHERADAAAQHGLLAEEIGFRLLCKRRLDDSRAGHADAFAVGERQRARLARGILVHGEQRRRTSAFDVELADAMAR